MNALTRFNGGFAGKWNAGQLDLIRTTIAKSLSDRMFNQFIESATRLNLDPLKKQIVPIVFRKKELSAVSQKWEWVPYLTLITTIDGYRAIADRTGNYRPDDKLPRYVIDEQAKNPDNNPLGIVSCEVSVFKFSHGEWFEAKAIAYWDEYVPLKTVGGDDDADPDAPAKPKRQIIDPGTQWGRRPRGQIAKCAEALACRKAWPEDFAGLHVEEEMDRAKTIDGEIIDLTPAEQAESAATERRLDAVRQKDSILIDWMNGTGALTPVPLGQLHDRCMEFIDTNRVEIVALASFQERNKHALREFWAKAPSDALDVKKAFEEAIGRARKNPEETAETTPSEATDG